jgi:hypothetical protein
MDINILKIRGTFMDLLDKLENISVDYINLNGFIDYIYMDPRNEYNYKISSVTNNNEVYTFYFIKTQNNEFEIIPNAIFYSNYYYDFEIDTNLKKFKKFDEYKLISIEDIKHTIINMEIEVKQKAKQSSIFRKLFNC